MKKSIFAVILAIFISTEASAYYWDPVTKKCYGLVYRYQETMWSERNNNGVPVHDYSVGTTLGSGDSLRKIFRVTRYYRYCL